MKKTTITLVVVLAIFSAFLASTARADTLPTDSVDWRAADADFMAIDGSSLTDAQVWEFMAREGTTAPGYLASGWNSKSTAIKAFLSKFADESTGTVQPEQLSLFGQSVRTAESAVESGAAGTIARRATTSAFLSAADLGLAPAIVTNGAIVLGALGTASLVQKAVVAGENKLFGWNIQLKGPFGIFGSWSGYSANNGPDLSSAHIFGTDGSNTGHKWVMANQTVGPAAFGCCGTTVPEWNLEMNAATGTNFPISSDPHCADGKCLMIFGFTEQDTDSNGNLQPIGVHYTAPNVPYCDVIGWSTVVSPPITNDPSKCNTTVYGELRARDQYDALLSEKGAIESLGVPTHWVERPSQTSFGHAEAISLAVVPSDFQRVLDGDHSYAYERDAQSGDSTSNQGDPLQPSAGYVGSLAGPQSTLTDAQIDHAQKAGRITPDMSNAANNGDCSVVGGGCPNPFSPTQTVPTSGCIGQTVPNCVSALKNAGFDGNYVETDLGKDSAVLTLPAGSVVSINPSGGSDASPDQQFELEVNPAILPIELPDRASGNEIATDWESRLRAAGYTGTITYKTVDPSAADPNAGPDATTFPVQDTTTGTSLNPGDRLEPGDDITVYTNPDNVPPVSEETPPSCDCPPLDFSPLTGMGLGSKFPFGIFTYAAQIIGDFNVTPQAPEFALGVHAVGVDGRNLDSNYDVNLGYDGNPNHVGSSLDVYMGWWRDLLSFAIWVGAVWFVGSRILGFNGAGDPGESMDDVL